MKLNRRQFLQTTVAGLVAVPLLAAADRAKSAAAPTALNGASDVVAILNDTHIGEEHNSNHPHPTNLRAAVAWLLALPQPPAAVIINGDLALKVGKPGDYQAFIPLIAPLKKAGLPVHLTLGNHDNREEFLRAFPEERSASQFKDLHRPFPPGPVPLARICRRFRGLRLLLFGALTQCGYAPGSRCSKSPEL